MTQRSKLPEPLTVSPAKRSVDLLIEQILQATETNGICEGLPPFTPEFREKLRRDLEVILSQDAAN